MWKKCFKHLDFMVVYDRFMTADAMYADIVLPATHELRESGVSKIPRGILSVAAEGDRSIEEARSGYTFLAALAKGLGYGGSLPGN